MKLAVVRQSRLADKESHSLKGGSHLNVGTRMKDPETVVPPPAPYYSHPINLPYQLIFPFAWDM
jgi:hypothetical protein